jgi:hypothetical protein
LVVPNSEAVKLRFRLKSDDNHYHLTKEKLSTKSTASTMPTVALAQCDPIGCHWAIEIACQLTRV